MSAWVVGRRPPRPQDIDHDLAAVDAASLSENAMSHPPAHARPALALFMSTAQRLAVGMLIVGLVLVALCGLVPTPVWAASAKPMADPAPPLTERLTVLINQLRLQQGLRTLHRHAALDAIANAHSQWMAEGRQLSHLGFVRRFEQAQAALCVETLGAGSPTRPERYINAWLDSASHRVNLLEPRTGHVGVAEVRGYITVFACEMDTDAGPGR